MNSISYQLTALLTRSFERIFPAPEHFRYIKNSMFILAAKSK